MHTAWRLGAFLYTVVILACLVKLAWAMFATRYPKAAKPVGPRYLNQDQHTADRQAHVHELQKGFRNPKGRS